MILNSSTPEVIFEDKNLTKHSYITLIISKLIKDNGKTKNVWKF